MARAARIMKRAVDAEASKIPAYITQDDEETKRTKPSLPEVKVPFCFPQADRKPSSRKEAEMLSYWFGVMVLKVFGNDQLSEK